MPIDLGLTSNSISSFTAPDQLLLGSPLASPALLNGIFKSGLDITPSTLFYASSASDSSIQFSSSSSAARELTEVSAANPFSNTPAYIDSSYFTDVSFGDHSHWLQPWRAYSETVPATTFLNGIGLGLDLNNQENPDLVLQMLATHGVRNVRIEIGWNNLSYDTETLENDKLQAILEASKKWEIRPLILLNANQGVPTPTQFFNRTVTSDAQAGSQQIRLDDTSGLVIGKSGLNNLTDYWAAEAIVTAIDGNTVTLSKPIPKAISAGTSVSMATLKYRPFSEPGSADYNETIAGWQHYVGTVAEFAANALGTTQSADKGFDMEIWNELTFGSEFLSINNYYERDPSAYDEESIWDNLVKATADYAVANPSQFSGVQFTNGFANTIPWTASSQQPERITAISKHPYIGRKTYPADEQNGTNLDALGQPSDFVPTYSTLFPEYFATALQTETIIRDTAPLSTYIYDTQHGRYAREVDGKVIPTEVWITEVGIAPDENGIIDRDQALALKAKTTARYYTFYLNKGVTKVDLYSAASGDLGLGIVQDNFLDYAKSNSVYPVDDSAYISPALQVTGRIAAKMQENLDPKLTQTRSLSLDSITDTHNHYQFAGDGTAAHPNLYNRDVFAFLPYQVNSSRFVIPYYVMTRDVTQDLPPEEYTIQISGLEALGASVSIYDPIGDRAIPVTINSRGSNFLNLTLTATDYPYLLIIQENKLLKPETFNNSSFSFPIESNGTSLAMGIEDLITLPINNGGIPSAPFFPAFLPLENNINFKVRSDVNKVEDLGLPPTIANYPALKDGLVINTRLNENEEVLSKYPLMIESKQPINIPSGLDGIPQSELKLDSHELPMSEDPIDVTAPVYLLDHAAVYNLNPVKQIITDFIEEGIQVPKFEELTSRFRLISSLKNFSAYGLSLNRRRSQY